MTASKWPSTLASHSFACFEQNKTSFQSGVLHHAYSERERRHAAIALDKIRDLRKKLEVVRDKIYPSPLFGRVQPFSLLLFAHSPSLHGISAESETKMSSPSDQTRRTIILTAFATAVHASAPRSAAAEEDPPGSDLRPQKADVLVFAEGDHAGEVIKPQDLKAGGPPVRAWPKDPKTSVVRKASRLNEVVIVKLDPAELDDDTRPRSADGIVAYSAICSHAGCPITAWVKAAQGDKDKEVLKCVCHNSEFDPRRSAQVVFGPAPRRLAALPLAVADGSLSIAGTFVGKAGAQQGG